MRDLMGRCTKCDVTIKVVLGTLTPEEARKKLEGIQMFECPGHHVELSGPLGYWEIDWATVHETDSPSLVQAAQDVLEWAAQMGGWEAPCWERLRKALRQAASAQATDAQEALRHIYDLLYLDIGPTGDFHNPDKVWCPDTLDAIARVVRERFKGPDCPADRAGQETADDAG